jgi:LPXTG-site transpeptidase (sortase) family protein
VNLKIKPTSKNLLQLLLTVLLVGILGLFSLDARPANNASRLKISDNLSLKIPSTLTPVSQPESLNQDVRPTRLTIPKINLDVTFAHELGVKENGEAEVPTLESNQPGWYKFSPLPGALGPSVILGHAFNYQGPSVFYNLKDLSSGDEITINMSDNTKRIFTVEKVETYSKNNFPTEIVYGNTDYPALRLVTCGDLDISTYTFPENRVVFGRVK